MSLFIVIFSIAIRLIPHLPNFSPEIIFALYLGMKNTKIHAGLYILLMAILSDLLLGFSLGSWVIFTYSALLAIGAVGFYIKKKGFGGVFMASAGGGVTLAYWFWTNLGSWLFTTMYTHTLDGFIACYTLALPFLGSALAASFAWCAIIAVCEIYVAKKNVYETA